MSLDLSRINQLVVNRLRLDAEGQAVRDILGVNGQGVRMAAALTCIIHADDLDKTPLPAAPFLAWRRMPTLLSERVVHRASYTWWMYDDRAQGYARLDELYGLIMRAYALRTLDQDTGGVIGAVELGDGGAQLFDRTLQRNASSINLYITAA